VPAVPSADRFLELVVPAAGEAAALARRLEGRVANRPKHGEASPAKSALTEADIACQEVLLRALAPEWAFAGLEAEESTATVAAFPGGGPGRIVIDPIDGTLRAYLEGRGPYAILAGLEFGGRFEAAVVALPREGLLLAARRGSGARAARIDAQGRVGTPAPCRVSGRGRRVLVSHEMPAEVRTRLREAGLEIGEACGGALAVAPLLPGVRAGLRRATTPGGVSIRGRIGLLVAREAGAVAAGPAGAFPEQVDEPAAWLVSAASATDAERFRKMLAVP